MISKQVRHEAVQLLLDMKARLRHPHGGGWGNGPAYTLEMVAILDALDQGDEEKVKRLIQAELDRQNQNQ